MGASHTVAHLASDPVGLFIIEQLEQWVALEIVKRMAFVEFIALKVSLWEQVTAEKV